jgi:hypothetical protein
MASNYFTDRHRVTREDLASMIIVKPARKVPPFSLK